MFKIFQLGMRNIRRNKRRTVITVIMIAFGIVVTTFVSGFLGAMSEDLKDYAVEGSTGEIQVTARESQEGGSQSRGGSILSTGIFVEELQREEGVVSLAEKVTVSGLLSKGKEAVYCNGTAVDPGEAAAALPMMLIESNGSGRSLNLDREDGVIIGAGAAGKLQAGIGDQLELVSYDHNGDMKTVKLVVTDIARYSTDGENDSKVIMSYRQASRLYGTGDDATAISIRIDAREKTAGMVDYLNGKYGERYQVTFTGWQDLMGSNGQTLGMFQAVRMVMLLIMAVAVLIGVVNTILMSVFERVDEIGTLRAIGTSRRRITALFMAESFWTGLVGIIIGAAAGLLVVYLTGIRGIPFSAPGTTQTFYIKPVLQGEMFVSSALVLMVVSILAGIYPARFAARLDPVEAMRRS